MYPSCTALTRYQRWSPAWGLLLLMVSLMPEQLPSSAAQSTSAHPPWSMVVPVCFCSCTESTGCLSGSAFVLTSMVIVSFVSDTLTDLITGRAGHATTWSRSAYSERPPIPRARAWKRTWM